jgi:hypothetical protein
MGGMFGGGGDNGAAAAQAAAQQAALKAQIESQRQVAAEKQNAANQAAYQAFETSQGEQQLRNQAASQQALAKETAAGAAATGGGIDVAAANKAQLANLGAAGGFFPKYAANAAGTAANPVNPALTTAASAPQTASNFRAPQLSGLQIS